LQPAFEPVGRKKTAIRETNLMDNKEEYLVQTEPDRAERSYNWKTAIGLQQVDGLTPSKYLIDTANANIEGKISLGKAEQLVAGYYERNIPATDDEKRNEEADKVSLRIAELLAGKTFTLSPTQLTSIHQHLFTGIYDHAGKIRVNNITKKEWILNGETVYYGDFRNIREALDYDFDKEKTFDYSLLDARKTAAHIVKFIADLWQIHAFSEGNTRTIAVFTIKYLRTLGYDVTNDTFEKNSLYFRNALVRAHYNNHKQGVKAELTYLNRFFDNLLFGEQYELKNRDLHIPS
jgi:fido (protein-threonine AMPylation protein)